MCMEDFRIQRQTYNDELTTQLPAAGGIFVNEDPRRISLILANPGAAVIYVSTKGVPAVNTGIPIPVNGSIVLDILHHGDMVRRAWFGFVTGGVAGPASFVGGMLDAEAGGITDTVERYDNARSPV